MLQWDGYVLSWGLVETVFLSPQCKAGSLLSKKTFVSTRTPDHIKPSVNIAHFL